MATSNAELVELLSRAAGEEQGHRVRALRRAARAAMLWPEEASDVVASDRELRELPAVGPWISHLIEGWLEHPSGPVDRPALRRGFLTRAEVRATIAEHASWRDGLVADLQMHSTYSDGRATMIEMLEASRAIGHCHVVFTDHSKGLPIAHGMDEDRLRAQGAELSEINETFGSVNGAPPIEGLHGIEMNLSPEGAGDMDPRALAELDLVLGAFHSKLRTTDDQTERYLAAMRNPDVQVLAHPRGRKFDRRLGLAADWHRVFAAAADAGKAVEIDAHPDRQDLDVELLRIARDVGVWISIGTDAHSTEELRFQEFGIAAAILAGVPRERILNFLAAEELREWVAAVRERAKTA
jgi:histidinol phosphatase-like PHP family hydrolase